MLLRRLPRPNVFQKLMTVCADPLSVPLRGWLVAKLRRPSLPISDILCHALIVKLDEFVQGSKCNDGVDLMADEFDRERTICRRYF